MNELAKTVAIILTTAADIGEPLPLGPLYLGLMERGITLDEFYGLISVIERAGLAVATTELLTLTPEGRAKALELQRFIDETNASHPSSSAHLN